MEGVGSLICRLGVADDPRVFLDEGGHRLFVEGLTKRSGIETFLDVQPPGFPRLVPQLVRRNHVEKNAVPEVERPAINREEGTTLAISKRMEGNCSTRETARHP